MNARSVAVLPCLNHRNSFSWRDIDFLWRTIYITIVCLGIRYGFLYSNLAPLVELKGMDVWSLSDLLIYEVNDYRGDVRSSV